MYYEPTPRADHEFISSREERIMNFLSDEEFFAASAEWRAMALERKFMNNFSWLGRPLIQLPGDVMAVQELISSIRPTVVVETGVAHGGSLFLSASMQLLNGLKPKVLGIDIDIRAHNKKAIKESIFGNEIELIEGSSIDGRVLEQVRSRLNPNDVVMVFLDSNHTHDHVLEELRLYAPLVTKGSYLVVFDTHVEDMPDNFVWSDRPWGKGNNPKTAVHEWIVGQSDFVIDKRLEAKVMITSAPDGFLHKIS
jgi:cephalosporin hydroxylase